MKNVFRFLATLVICFLFSACSSGSGNKFIGTWQNNKQNGDNYLMTIRNEENVFIVKTGDYEQMMEYNPVENTLTYSVDTHDIEILYSKEKDELVYVYEGKITQNLIRIK